MKLKGSRFSSQLLMSGVLMLAFQGLAVAQTAYFATQPAFPQLSGARSALEMQTRFATLIQDPTMSVPVVVSTALASGMTPSRMLAATSATVPGKLSQVVTPLAISSQSPLDAASLMQQIGSITPAQSPVALRAFAVGKPDLLPSAVGAAVAKLPEQSPVLVSAVMAAVSNQEGGAGLVKAIQSSAVRSNPPMTLTYTGLAMSFTSGKDAEDALKLGISGAGVPSALGGAVVCSGSSSGKQPTVSQCQVSPAIQALAATARTQQIASARATEKAVADAIGQTAPLQGLVGNGIVGGGINAPDLINATNLVGTLVSNPGLVSTGTTP